MFAAEQKLVISQQSECKCGKKNMVSYTEEKIKYVMIACISDDDIRREVLSTKDILSRSSFDIISFIKSKEMAWHATYQR